MSRWRTGGDYELVTLLDKEAYFLRASATEYLNYKLGQVEQEIAEFLKAREDA